MKQNLFFFYKSSHGELHAGLPFLLEILKQKKDVTPYFVYSKKRRFDCLPDFYKKIVNENFTPIYANNFKVAALLFKHLLSKNFIFTCDSGHTPHSRFLTCYWPFSRVAFFHHAYAILGDEISSKVRQNFYHYQNRFNGYQHAPLIVAHNPTEITYREKFGFLSENIIVAGNLGYKAEWVKYLESSSTELDLALQEKQSFSKTVFIPTRDSHPQFLSNQNSIYLLNAIVEAIKTHPDYLFLIKLHPRQKNIDKYKNLEATFSNVKLTYLSTTTASSISDLVVSYWSSAITDALSTNTAVVEFHRHETPHNQLARKGKKLISLYHYHHLCPFIETKEELLSLISHPEKWEHIRKKQQVAFMELFMKDYNNFVDRLFERLENSTFNVKYFANILLFPFNFKKRKIIKQ